MKSNAVEIPPRYGDAESFLIYLEFCYTGQITLDVTPKLPLEVEDEQKKGETAENQAQHEAEDVTMLDSSQAEKKIAMLESDSDEIYPTCIRAYGMAQKLQCDKLCNLCIEHMLEHCETLTTAGYWGFPRPSDVVLAWKVTWSHCTLRQFCAIIWRHPEASGGARIDEDV